ncbi:MAG: hypothetical protein ACI857_000164 [Arenicella sp.]|jgi:hypothetical protein
MKATLLIFLVGLGCISFSQDKWQDGFQLRYSFAGLGSNMGSGFAGFILDGNHFQYVTEINSCYKGQSTDPDVKLEGELSDEVMNGIMDVFNVTPDTSIYETNLSVMSGGVHTITMGSAVKMVKFTLHNASHVKAQTIVDLINSGLPEEYQTLWLHREATNKTY